LAELLVKDLALEELTAPHPARKTKSEAAKTHQAARQIAEVVRLILMTELLLTDPGMVPKRAMRFCVASLYITVGI
jgi:hypothetical protein